MIGWISALAAVIVASGIIWARVIRPLARGCAEALDLLRQILEVAREWPVVTASVTTHTGELSALAMQVGAIDLREQDHRRELDEIWGVVRPVPPRKATPRRATR